MASDLEPFLPTRAAALAHRLRDGTPRAPAGRDHSGPAHVANLAALLESLDLHDITLVAQHWVDANLLNAAGAPPDDIRKLLADARALAHYGVR